MAIPFPGNRRLLIKSILNKSYKPVLEKYLSQDRSYSYKNIHIIVKKGVFHPGLFHSTEFLLKYLSTLDLKDKSLLELGAGSGLISIYAAKQGARVTASDISRAAVENVNENKQFNKVDIEVLHSDLFEKMTPQVFDRIVMNPPFYKGKWEEEQDYAWYYGEDESYFTRLFSQLGHYMASSSRTYMVLSEDCNIEMIKNIALQHHFTFTVACQKRKYWELLYIFEIQRPLEYKI